MVGTYPVKNKCGTDEYDIKATTKQKYEMEESLLASRPGCLGRCHGSIYQER